jgi:hypothetical protein
MFGQATMAELWDRVGTTVTDRTYKAQEGLLGGRDAYIGGEILVGMLQAR